jgi:hypothetical protein
VVEVSTYRELLDEQLAIAEVGHNTQPAAECLDVGPERGERGSIEFTLLQARDVRLSHADDVGDLDLGERPLLADLRKTVGTDLGVELGAVFGHPDIVGDGLGMLSPWRVSGDGVPEGEGGLAEGGELVGGNRQVAIAMAGGEDTDPPVAAEQRGRGRVRALDQVDRAKIADLARAALGVGLVGLLPSARAGDSRLVRARPLGREGGTVGNPPRPMRT